jgi:predicted nucleic acid-binding Zn ribbon protein
VLHPVGIVFKGTGFYITDNRKPEPSEDGSAGKAGKNGAESKKSDQPAKPDKVAAAAD